MKHLASDCLLQCFGHTVGNTVETSLIAAVIATSLLDLVEPLQGSIGNLCHLYA